MQVKAKIIATIVGVGFLGAMIASAASPSQTSFDADIARHAQAMLDEGRKTFRYETFGSEAFWGDALQLHKAIAGEKNGGVGALILLLIIRLVRGGGGWRGNWGSWGRRW